MGLNTTGGMMTFTLSDQFSRIGLAGIFLLAAVLAFGGLIYRMTGMVWGTPPDGVVRGEIWTLGHVPIILLAVALVGFTFFPPQPIRQLLNQATSVLLLD